ncbi:MAG TPA: HAD-IA family hydrolase [Gemmatimonadales bacterium]|nr:HAD-IA family hydrolase [Gemmatimonadales bacterium]
MKAVLFDAGNTLIYLDHERMAAEVGAALGVPITAAALDRSVSSATRAVEGAVGVAAGRTDRERARVYLEALFTGAGVPAERMDEVARTLRRLHEEWHLWCRTMPGTSEALDRLRAAGLRLGVISNSDGRVEEALRAAGIDDRFDVILDSALVGVEKPDPAIFRAALAALDVGPGEALYVGDLYDVDVVGARAAGIEAVLLVTDAAELGPECRRVDSLVALADDLLTGGRT